MPFEGTPMEDLRKIVFCATQRTGSALVVDDFCNLLGGWPVDAEALYTDIFRVKSAVDWPELWRKTCASNRIGDFVVVKVMFHYAAYIADFMRGVALPRRPPLFSFDPKRLGNFYAFFQGATWVHIQRRDICAQAVSMYFAENTDLWERRSDPGSTAIAGTSYPPYDRVKLLDLARRLQLENAQWNRFFEHNRISPIHIFYEEAASDYPKYLDELVSKVGAKPKLLAPGRRMFKLGTERNTEYVERLRKEFGGTPGAAP